MHTLSAAIPGATARPWASGAEEGNPSGPSELGPACRLAGSQAGRSQGPPPLCLPRGAACRGVDAQAPGPVPAFQMEIRRPRPEELLQMPRILS